ncbi:MAG TPA: BACON domain-containing carbohydrate-binding protein, partial [Chthoniobacterales bacterium]
MKNITRVAAIFLQAFFAATAFGYSPYQFAAGQKIRVISQVSVRSGTPVAGVPYSGTPQGSQNANATGTVVSGPVRTTLASDGRTYDWYQINYDASPFSGWSAALEIPFDDSPTRSRFLGLHRGEVANAAHQAQFHGFGLIAAMAIAEAESSGMNPSAVGDFSGSTPTSFGLWQIHTTVHTEYNPQDMLSSPYHCAQAAWSLSQTQTYFHDWTTWYKDRQLNIVGDGNGYYKDYVSSARAALAANPSIDPTVITGANLGSAEIRASGSAYVRDTPGGNLVSGTNPRNIGDTGTIIDGAPGTNYLAQVGGTGRYYFWWKVRWSDGQVGWSGEDFLEQGQGQPGIPVITSVSPTSIGINQGGTFTITYTINALSPRTVILGASLFPAGQVTGRIDDPPHDQVVALLIGQNIVQRQFTVPAATPVGPYDLVVALWSDVNGNGIIDPGVDQEITEKTNANAVSVTSGGGCSYSLYPVELNLTSPGGATSSFNIATGSSCHWAAIPNQNWISINGVGSGDGCATVAFNVSTNSGASPRVGTITVQSQTFTITQSGNSGDPQNVTVSNVLVSPPSSRPGLTPTFYANVNSPISQNVLLGGAIVLSGTASTYYDPAHDTPATLIAGLTQYHRLFTIPTNVATGTYDVIFSVWTDNNGNGQVDPGVDTLLGTFTGYGALTVQPALGGIYTTLTPQGAVDAGAQWRCDGGNWLGSGAQNFQVAVGNHTVSFEPVSGWTTPADQVVTVNTNQTTQVAGVYAPAGSLQVNISPPGAINAGAQWQVDGGGFQNSGTTLSDLSTGNHTVSFNSVTGYTTPANQVVTINANQTTTATGIYVVSLTPTPTATPGGTPTPTATPVATPTPTATPPPASPTPTPVLPVQLGNISTRLRVGTGDNAMIGGFIITGTQPKTVIVRGMGPSLPVPGVLADPVIEVHGSSGVILATNDNWRDDDPVRVQHVIDSGLAPSNDLEAAKWGILNPDAYTVIVRGNNNATGV